MLNSYLCKKVRIMKKLFLILLLSFYFINNEAQKSIFNCELTNDEYRVYMKINLYDQNVRVPGQDIYGDLPGYFGNKDSQLVWPVVKSKLVNDSIAEIQLINDYGSEDLSCTLSLNNDGSYTLHQDEGSTLKIVVKNKYVKIPGSLKLKRKP